MHQQQLLTSKVCVLRNLNVPEDYVPASFPKFIETCPTNYKCWIDFKTICSKSWVLKKLSKAFQISFNTNIWKIRHHVRNNLQTSIEISNEKFHLRYHIQSQLCSVRSSRPIVAQVRPVIKTLAPPITPILFLLCTMLQLYNLKHFCFGPCLKIYLHGCPNN